MYHITDLEIKIKKNVGIMENTWFISKKKKN